MNPILESPGTVAALCDMWHRASTPQDWQTVAEKILVGASIGLIGGANADDLDGLRFLAEIATYHATGEVIHISAPRFVTLPDGDDAARVLH